MNDIYPATFAADEIAGITITNHERKALSLGIIMQLNGAPDNDCTVYLNIWRMLSDLGADYGSVASDAARRSLRHDARRLLTKLETMYVLNYAVKKYRRERGV